MTVPAVRCTSCAFAWNSAAMAEGLRLIGSCPKCGGDLTFREDVLDASGEPMTAPGAEQDGGLAPHLGLGIPRR